MATCLKPFGCGVVASVFWAACALAQTAQPETAKQMAFPLAEVTTPLDRATIEATVAKARAVDVNVTVPAAILYQGLMLSQEEKYAESIPFLEEALRKDPSMLAGWEALGWAYIKTEKEEKAWQLWEYFRQLMPNEWMPYNLLAQAAIMRQDWVKADQHFRKALEKKPELFDLRFWFAQNLLRIGKPAEAEKVFRQLIKEEPDRLDIQINLANLLTHRLEYDEAVGIWRKVNAELPGNADFMMDQAVLELRVGELKTADQLCLDVLEIDKTNMRAMTMRADIAEIGDMSEESLKRLRDLIDATDDKRLRGQLRVRLANRCLAQNERTPGVHDTDEILDQIRRAIDENPTDVPTQVLYAEVCVKTKHFAEAKKWAIHVLEKFNRHNIRAKSVLFEVAVAEQRYDDAEQALHDRYSNFDATDPMRFYFEARLNMSRGAYREAMQSLDRMEAAAEQGTVFTLLYRDLTESDWVPVTSVRRLYDHLNALKREGFTIISPADVPSVIGLPPGVGRKDPEPVEDSVPWTARFIDTVQYGITGERKFKSGKKVVKEPAKPMKVAVVTFDDALRSSFALGSSVAEDLGVPFGMFVVTKPSKDYKPSFAGWEEIVEYAATGAWVIGSQLYGTDEKMAVDAEKTDIRLSLPNRVWLPAKNRLESMNEWDKRMRFELRMSRGIVREKMGDNDSPVPLVAYPYGDIGQEGACNLALLRNPAQSIVAESLRNYQVGFVQGYSGYTTAGDNLQMVRRHEPNWFDEGDDVVRHAYEFHPLFMARRTRVELAFLMNRPHLAEEMLELLKRDGYPEELRRRITVEVRSFFRNRPNRDVRPLVVSTSVPVDSVAGGGQSSPTHNVQSMQAMPPSAAVMVPEDPTARAAAKGKRSDLPEYQQVGEFQEGNPDPWVYLSHPFVGGEISHSKANDQFEILRYGGRGGLNLNKNLQLSAEYFMSEIEQRIAPRWNAVENSEFDDIGLLLDDPYYDASRVKMYVFKALKREARGRLSYRSPSGAVFSGSLGLARLDLDYERGDWLNDSYFPFEDVDGSRMFDPNDSSASVIGDLVANWSPRDDLNLHVFYARDVVMSAIKKVESDSVGAVARWKPTDSWHVTTRGQYWSYTDDNALFYLQADSFKETNPDMGIWLGLDASTISSSEPSDYYWTPYWDQRAMGVLRYLQVWQGYMYRFDVLGGFQREDGRPLRSKYDIGLSKETDWSLTWGLSSTYNKRIFKYCDIFADASIMAMRDYIDHRFLIGFNLTF